MSADIQRHFAVFMSPGTFAPETTERPIDSWDPKVAMDMARTVRERYNATPFGFYFTTRTRGPNDLDSKVTATSHRYYLGGTIRTAEDVLAGTDPAEDILRFNVRANHIKRLLVNDNSWRFTTELKDDDVVLDFVPNAALSRAEQPK